MKRLIYVAPRDSQGSGGQGMRVLAMVAFLVATMFLAIVSAAPARAADAPAPAWTASLYSGTAAVLTASERREFVTARASLSGPLTAGFEAFARADLGGTQDGGGLDIANPRSFRSLEGAGGVRHAVGPLRVSGVGALTFSAEGEEGRPVDGHLFTGALLIGSAIGDGGYVELGGGWHGPVGGWALLGALSVPTGPAFAVVDYAFPLSVTALQGRAWVVKVGAQVRVKRIRLGG